MKISDVIEQFILSMLGEDSCAQISRNELASYFRCSPSQINYVLQTRFTIDRGYAVDSQRGGGGYIRISRLPVDGDCFLYNLLESAGNELSYLRFTQILECLSNAGLLTENELRLMCAAASDRALASPANAADSQRANILHEVILHILKAQKEADDKPRNDK